MLETLISKDPTPLLVVFEKDFLLFFFNQSKQVVIFIYLFCLMQSFTKAQLYYLKLHLCIIISNFFYVIFTLAIQDFSDATSAPRERRKDKDMWGHVYKKREIWVRESVMVMFTFTQVAGARKTRSSAQRLIF